MEEANIIQEPVSRSSIKKDLTPISLKTMQKWLISTSKDAQPHSSSGKANSDHSEIPPPTRQDGYYQNNNKNHTTNIGEEWRIWTLLVEM